ncbi:efflux RND transporter periplasmic adaptor subunit [Aureimonas pseudogalii]|uniref:Multidrug efflux system membrane fusion protein n=1 Tax=Aureimonas pseudogalii TaxID=1744844 RepID=A0A7W6H6J7_9HYPH|nr:efflux RND transporter periplasmic adaptor subunit [Aureimonas pseudogalii]MBB3999461.1 multidrug efflux system membrane fusion protein [Aureimonas pseudogalii]
MSTMHPSIKWALASVALVGAAFGGTGFGPGAGDAARADKPAAAAMPSATPASVARVEARRVATWTKLSGRLEAVERVELRARVAGALEATHFREGALVARGDLLVTLDPAPFEAAVLRAQAAVEGAEARLAFAAGERERGLALQGTRTLAASDVERRVQAGLEAAADLASARAALRTAELDLSYTRIRAPIAGRIGRIEVDPGNLVAAGAGSPVLATLVSVDPIYASFDVDEATVGRALAALPDGRREAVEAIAVEMDRGDGSVAAGRIQMIDPAVDPVNGTVRVRASFPNPGGRLMPGQFARLRLGEPQAGPAVLVSERAVGTDQDRKYVLVVDRDDKAEYRSVTLGAAVDGLRIVTEGLDANERVVVNGLQRIRSGALLAPQMVAMDGAGDPSLQAAAEPAQP